MQLSIDPTSAVPIYHQLTVALRAAIASGALPAESVLPAVRELAAQIGINYHTVAKAYQALEAEGLLTRRRGGPFCVTPGVQAQAGLSELEARLITLAREALAQGHAPQTLLPLWPAALEQASQAAVEPIP
jgi:GntR family transcriptional regulator